MSNITSPSKDRELSSGHYKIISELYKCNINSDFAVVYSPLLPSGPIVLDTHALNCLQTFEMAQPLEKPIHFNLAQSGVIVPLDFERKQIEENQSFLQMHDILNVWLHITNTCNLNCSYCCIAKTNAHMSKEIGLKTIQTVFETAKNNEFRTVFLKYSGGEPTLRFELVQALQEYASRLARENSLDLQAVVLSNGTTWTDHMVDWLVKSNVGLVISLDGVGEDHDIQRSTKGGQGSFTRIERTIDTILIPAGIRPYITITVTGRNAHAAADAAAWAIERNLPIHLNLYRESDNSSQNKFNAFEEKQIIDGLRSVYQVIENLLPTRSVYLGQLLDSVLLKPHKYSCSAGQSYLVFSHTGQLAQCPQHLSNSEYLATSNAPLQTIAHGKIPIISVDDKEECKDCIWRYRCAGGCPEETYRIKGRYNVNSPHCNIYKTLLPDILRLEGLRILFKAGYGKNNSETV